MLRQTYFLLPRAMNPKASLEQRVHFHGCLTNRRKQTLPPLRGASRLSFLKLSGTGTASQPPVVARALDFQQNLRRGLRLQWPGMEECLGTKGTNWAKTCSKRGRSKVDPSSDGEGFGAFGAFKAVFSMAAVDEGPSLRKFVSTSL